MTTHTIIRRRVGHTGAQDEQSAFVKITMPGPAWQDPAPAQHQRPTPEPVRLTKTAPRGTVTAKDRPEPARITELKYGQLLASSIAATAKRFEAMGQSFKIGGQPSEKADGVQRGAAPVLDIMPVGKWVSAATVTDTRNSKLPPGEPQVSREATLNNLTRLLRRGFPRKRLVQTEANDGRFKEAQFCRIK